MMDDVISRQAAVDALTRKMVSIPTAGEKDLMGDVNRIRAEDISVIRRLPSAHPEKRTEERTETHTCDLISRQAAVEAIENTDWYHLMDGVMVRGANSKEHQAWYKEQDIYKALEQLPSAQPEQTNSWYINSWCNNCKEYDKKNKCCPRYNRVIKQTLDDAYRHGETEAETRFHAQQRWIPCSERLPENGHYYLWCSDMGSVQSDYYWDGFENGMKYGYNIVAWMPLPEPYAERRTDEQDSE